MIPNIICSFLGTVSFSILYNVPRKYYLGGGITGMVGWLCYCLVYPVTSPPIANFFSTVLVMLISRGLAVFMKSPITLFLVPGIFPLLPGANVYYTAYYLVTDNLARSAANGITAVKLAFAMVMAIVLVFSIPREVFQPSYWKSRRMLKKGQEE